MLKKSLLILTLLLVLPTLATALPKQGMSASCVYCHNGNIPIGDGASGCGGCHVNPPATGAHLLHTDGAEALYGSDTNGSGLTMYRFNCGNCHPTNPAGHGNKTTDVELYNSAASGFKKNNPATAGRTGAGAATTCINIYCHSAGQYAGVNTYAATPLWGGTFSGNRCAGCHSFPPDYANNAPKANSHIPHAFPCETCHAGTTADGAAITNTSLHVNHSYDLAPGPGVSFSYTYAATGGTCSNISCHGDTGATWGGTAVCTACHGAPPPQAAAGYSGVDETTSPHMKHAGKGANYGFACSECHKGNKHGNGTFQDVFIDKTGIVAGPAAVYTAGTRTCSSLYCHGDGTALATGLPPGGSAVWGSGKLGCTGCHGSPPAYANGSPKANTHIPHNYSCNTCHAVTTVDGTTITNPSSHVNRGYDLAPGPGVSFAYTYAATGGTCSNISCHGNTSATWGGSATCLVCHSVAQGNRGAITTQFSANSHHIQGTVSNAHCYQCHWEANSDGSINTAYHHAKTPGAPVELVIYGAGVRPAAYVAGSTAIQYTANGTRGEIEKITSHCLGCHSDQNNATTPFGDGKTPKQYAWDGTSVAARYAQSGVTAWGKYPAVANAAQKKISKAYSAHGNSAANKRGWNTATGVDGTIADTSGAANVQCYDCHNSHGSTVTGVTTRYVSATANGGLLKTTVAGQGGYAVAYRSYTGGSVANKDRRNPGASLCLDCHQNGTAETTPWGFNSTFGATQPIIGYWDSPFMGYSTCGPEQRYPFKKKNGIKGGHFGASMALSSTPMATIEGLCTPCHDPHGVSPTLGANQQYAVPLLKGTWVTSPYKEDVPPANNAWLTNFAGYGEGVQYHIDQNTFGPTIRGAVTGVTQSVDQSAGLCLGCHPKNSLTATASPASPNPWKSKNRIHESVKGWKTSDGTVEHNYTCSKCHSAHTSSVLPRLMVTNCLDGRHKGRKGYNTAPVLSGSNWGDDGSGSGRIPGSYGGSGYYDDGPGIGLPAPGDVSVACHDSGAANGYGADGTNQGWNNVTPWIDTTPALSSGPYAISGGLRVFLHMDEASWNGTPNQVLDSSGGNNNGTSYNGATTVAGGKIGRAGSFNNSSVTINYASGMPPLDNFSMEAWIKPTTTHQVDGESNAGTGGTYGQKYLFKPDQRGPVNGGAGISAGTNGISVYEHGDSYMPALAVYNGAISSSQWTHVAVVYANRQPSIYVNGTLVRTGLQSLRQHVYAPQVIGVGDYGYFPGLVDEVAIYDRPLSAADVLAHAQLNYAEACRGEAVINWTTNINSTSYVDYGLTPAYGATAGLDQLDTNHTVTLSGLASETTYHYRVRSRNAGGIETVSGDFTFTMGACAGAGIPAPPTGISASAGNGQTVISWVSGTGATSSLIRYGTAPGLYTTTIDPAASPQTISNLTNGTAIYYQVGARNGEGTTWSAEYSVTPALPPPSAPTGISAAAGNAQATISWTAGAGSTSSLARYGTATGVYTTTIDPATSPLILASLTNGTTVYYQVGAKNGAGTTWSVQYSITPVAPPAAPTGTSAAAGNGQTTISWTAGAGASSSLIKFGTASGVYSTTIDPAVSPQTISGLTNGTTIYYRVGAKNAGGITWSAEFTVSPVAPPTASVPAAQPTAYVTGSGATAAIVFQWSTATAPDGDAIQYQVDVSGASSFAAIAYSSAWQAGTNWTVTLPVGTWYWRVKARDSVHTTAVSTSASSSFTVKDRTPPVPVLTPQTDSISTGGSVNKAFHWTAVPSPDGDAVQYLVEISGSSGFSTIGYSSGWIPVTSWTQAMPAGPWYWRVTARDSVHTGAISSPSASNSFTIVNGGSSGTIAFPVTHFTDCTLSGGVYPDPWNEIWAGPFDGEDVDRSFIMFDTSSLGTGVTVTSAKLYLDYRNADYMDSDTVTNVHASTWEFPGDQSTYNNVGVFLASDPVWTGRAFGLTTFVISQAYINRAGMTKFAIRAADEDYDALYNADPGYSRATSYLEITYTSNADPTPPPAILTPQPTSYVTGGGSTSSILFQWSAVAAPDGDAVQYLVEVSSASSFAAIAYNSAWQAGTNWTQSLPVGTWYWRVKTRDSVHTTAMSTSAANSFAVMVPPAQVWTTPGTYTFAVPAGVTSISVTASGGGGGGGLEDNVYNQVAGTSGDLVSAVIAVTPGAQLTVYVAGGGSAASNQDTTPGAGGSGYHPGGSGWPGEGDVVNGWAYGGSGGGGSSAIVQGSTRLVEAAGGAGGRSSDYDDYEYWDFDGGYYTGGAGGTGGGSDYPAATTTRGGGPGGGYGLPGAGGSVSVTY